MFFYCICAYYSAINGHCEPDHSQVILRDYISFSDNPYLFFHTGTFAFQILDKVGIFHDDIHRCTCGCHIQEAFRTPLQMLNAMTKDIRDDQ